MKDLYHDISVLNALSPAQITATTNGNIIDLAGYQGCTFVITTGAIAGGDADNNLTAILQEGDESDLSDAAAVAADDYMGTLPVFNDAAGQANSQFAVGYKGTKRYVRLRFVETGVADAFLSAAAILSHPRHMPTS